MTDSHDVPDDSAGYTWREFFEGVLAAYSTWIGLGSVGVLAAVWYFGISLPSVPRPLVIAGLSCGAGVGLGYLPAKKVISWLKTIRWIFLLVVKEGGDGIELWTFTPDSWAEVEVVEGELYQPDAIVEVYECTSFDRESMTAEATWRGSARPLELVADRERIAEIRETLEERAQQGIALRMRLAGIVRSALDDILNDLIGEVESASIYSGENIERAVEDALGDEADPQKLMESADGEQVAQNGESTGPSENGETPRESATVTEGAE
ncbi:hypothetical protein [Halorientalis litorea]|uniref:hypothetical protein n=1 Tax=Halorientalis litorea TaxID=2931977 RepID=UPI001FF424D5|nr:hypothetical protein [Halorientalis litorea]